MGKFFFYALLITLGIIILLIFPFVFTLDGYADVKEKKFSFALHFFDLIKVVGGYVTVYPQGLAFHITKKRAILMPFKEINSQREKFKFTECFKITEFYLYIQSGAEYFLPCVAVNRLLQTFFKINSRKKEWKSGLLLTNGDNLSVCICTRFYFNLYMLLQELIKTIKEKIAIYARKQ